MKHCKGCGVRLQNDDPQALGYVPSLDASYCQRCYKMTHYGEVTINMQQGIESNETFDKINALDCVVFWVVDLFCFEASMISRINQKLEGKDIILILTKRDLLPKTLSDEKVLDFVEERLEALEIEVKDILICRDLYIESHKKNYELSDFGKHSLRLVDYAIQKYRNGKDVVFMGMANVGKSTLLNNYLEDSTRTISRNPGTTLDLIPTEMEEGYTLYDTPGIENHHSVLTYLTPKDLKTVIPTKPIRPYISQIYENQSFAAGGLARLDIVTDGQASVVGYFSRSIPIHRGKLDDADRLWNAHLNEMLVPCIDTSLLTMHTFHAPKMEEEKMDVVIHGLGWFCISGSVKEIYVRVHKGIDVTFRKAMI